MSAICELSDLPVEQCACRIHKPAVREPYDVAHRFTANFSGRLGCDHGVHEGEEMARTFDGEYICGRCADDA